MINVAVVGLGRWGRGIVEAAAKGGRLRVVRGVSKEPELARDLAARHGFALSPEFAEALADPRVQAVLLATPHSLHVEQIVAVAAAGKPVWCEKPLALTLAEAARAVAACRAAGVPFALGNNKRCFAAMLELKRLVAAGTLGDVLHLEGHFCNEHSTRVTGGWRDDPAESPGGGLTGAGLHLIDALVHLAGPMREVDARLFAAKPPPDPRDAAALLCRFKSGATGLLATVRAAPMYWRVQVFGTRGWAEARDETTLTLATLGATPQTRSLPQLDSLALLLEAFADSIETGEPFPVTTEEMLDVVAAFEAAIASMGEERPVAVRR
jgi:predicted dehydrogenase